MVSNGAWNGKRKQTMKLCMHGEHMAEGLYYFDMNVSTVQDDEKLNWMVQQWLQERGYTKALKALQEVRARGGEVMAGGEERAGVAVRPLLSALLPPRE